MYRFCIFFFDAPEVSANANKISAESSLDMSNLQSDEYSLRCQYLYHLIVAIYSTAYPVFNISTALSPRSAHPLFYTHRYE